MKKILLSIIMLVLVLGAGFGAYTLLKPPSWETGNPLLADANGGPINLLDDLDTNNVGNGWKERVFFNITPTDYTITEEEGAQALRCTTNNSGSILGRETDIDLNDLPILSWQWKVVTPISSDVDEDLADGDDHPLRFYLRFSNAVGDTKGAEIIWSNQKYKPGDYKIIGSFYHLVSNGLDENVGSWHEQRVDLTELYDCLLYTSPSPRDS